MIEVDNYLNLCFAIVERAFIDLRKARETLKKKPNDKDSQEMVKDVEKFFKGELFDLISEFNVGLRREAEKEMKEDD